MAPMKVLIFILCIHLVAAGVIEPQLEDSANSEVYSITIKAKQTKRLEAKCPSDIYEAILELMERYSGGYQLERKEQSTVIIRSNVTAGSDGVSTPVTSSPDLTGSYQTTTAENTETYSSEVSSLSSQKSNESPLDQEGGTTNKSVNLPPECTSVKTLNLTESDRTASTHYNRLFIDYKFLDVGRVWFRFQGRAGKKLASSCLTWSGCGYHLSSNYAYWSNSTMPSLIGQTTEIIFYQTCNPLPENIYFGSATRCTVEDDGVVYRFEDEMTETKGIICGMN